MDLAVVELSRLQFALTAMYHFLFVPLTLGLSFVALLVSLGFLIWVAAKPGDLEANAYGAVASYAT